MKINIDNPCNENWEQMTGCRQKRFCGVCNKNVYNLSEMTKTEASTLLKTIEDPCVRFSEDENSNIEFRPSKAPAWFLLAAALTAGCEETEMQVEAKEIQIVEFAQPLPMPAPEVIEPQVCPTTIQLAEKTSQQNKLMISTEAPKTAEALSEKPKATSTTRKKQPQPPIRKKMGRPKVKIKR